MRKLADLKKIVRAASTPEDVKKALFQWQGKREAAIEVVFEHAPVFDDGLVFALLASGVSCQKIINNPNWPAKYNPEVIKWMVNRLSGEVKKEYLYAASGTLYQMFHSGRVPWDTPGIQSLVNFLLAQKPTAGDRHDAGTTALLAHPHVPLAVLEDVFSALGDRLNADTLCRLALHPQATPELRRRVIETGLPKFEYSHLQEIVIVREVRNDPYLRPALVEEVRIRAPANLLLFIQDLNPQDCASIFRMAPEFWAAAALRQKGEQIAPFLTRDDLAPLLASDDRETRLAALAQLGNVRDSATPSVPEDNTQEYTLDLRR